MLTYLAAEGQQPHSRDLLVGLLWPDLPEAQARNNLRVTLYRLRQVLGSDDYVTSNRRDVQTNPEYIAADFMRFQALLAATEQHKHAGRHLCGDCLPKLAQAAALYSGSFLAGFYLDDAPAFAEWLFVLRERLHMQVMAVLTDLALGEEINGRLPQAIHYSQRQIELDPLHEVAYRRQMRLQVQVGQRSAALTTYQKCRETLLAELGVDPEPETEQIYQQILAGDLVAEVKTAVSPLPTTALNHNLPEITTPFVGREEELDQLRQRLQRGDYRLISLVGPGGMGKTRLAIEAARLLRDQFADGAFFVPLASVQQVEGILTAVAEAIGFQFNSSAALQTQLLAYLQPRQTLLIVDNLEHLINGADVLLEWLRHAPRLTLLVTSRERLNSEAEDLFHLRGLPVPTAEEMDNAGQFAAVRLFCDRAYRLDKAFKLNSDNAADVVAICRLVDGLPLALELVATWVRDFPLAELASSVAGNLDMLETTLRDVAPHHRSMRLVFTHSWQLLTAVEQRTLARLALFQGGFSLAAARAVAEATPLVLTRLRYKSLIRAVGTGRYDMHELLRQFALAELLPGDPVPANHSHYFLNWLAEAGAAIPLELDNVRAAWRWGVENGRFADLAAALEPLAHFYALSGLSQEGEQMMGLALQAPVLPTDLRPRLLLELSGMQMRRSTYPPSLAAAEQAQALAVALGDKGLEAAAYVQISRVLLQLGQTAVAQQRLEQALVLAQATGDYALQASVLDGLSRLFRNLGQQELSKAYSEQALVLHRQLGNREGEQGILLLLGIWAAEKYDYVNGRFYFTEALTAAQAGGDRHVEARLVNGLGFIEAALGNLATARERHLASRNLCRQLGDLHQESHTLHNLCTVSRKMGDLDAAEYFGREALRLGEQCQGLDAIAYAWLHLGYLFLTQGELGQAAHAFHASREKWLEGNAMALAMEALAGLAEVARRRDEWETAVFHAQTVYAHLQQHGLAGCDELPEIYLSLFLIFQSQGDSRASDVLYRAQAHLQQKVEAIADPDMRELSLHSTLAQRQILALVGEWVG